MAQRGHHEKSRRAASTASRFPAPRRLARLASCSAASALMRLSAFLPSRGEEQRMRAPVDGRGPAPGETALLEPVQQAHQPRPLDAQPFRRVRPGTGRDWPRSRPAPNIAPDGCRSSPACARNPGRSTPAGDARNSRGDRRARRAAAPGACRRSRSRSEKGCSLSLVRRHRAAVGARSRAALCC